MSNRADSGNDFPNRHGLTEWISKSVPLFSSIRYFSFFTVRCKISKFPQHEADLMSFGFSLANFTNFRQKLLMPEARDLPPLLGTAPAFLAMQAEVARLAPLDRPILVVGERGTGKELVSARLHFLSPHWDQPFVKVNCAALSDDLLDSELFGHEAGAFTGAQKRRQGRFEQAHRGTLFLDEIATASARVQEKILRVVEYGEMERLGGDRVVSVDVRVVGATNIDLPAAVAAGRFRADLLDRLAFDVVTLPPLRNRLEDIPLLADHYGRALANDLGHRFPGFSPGAVKQMEKHDWPGNVRELRNVVERSTHRRLAADGASRPITELVLDPFASPHRPGTTLPGSGSTANVDGRSDLPALPSTAFDLQAHLAALEKNAALEALSKHQHHQGRAAEHLGLTYHQFRGVLKKHDLLQKGREDRDAPTTEDR